MTTVVTVDRRYGAAHNRQTERREEVALMSREPADHGPGRQLGDSARLARLHRLNDDAAARSHHEPADIALVGPRSTDPVVPAGRPIVLDRHYVDEVSDAAVMLFLLERYVERDERRDPDRRRSLRLSLIAAGLVGLFVAISATTRHLSLTSGLVLLVVVVAVLYIPTVMVDARVAREFMERVDYQAGYRYGPGAVEAYAEHLAYLRRYEPAKLPQASFGIFSTGLSEVRRRGMIAAGERAALDDAAA